MRRTVTTAHVIFDAPAPYNLEAMKPYGEKAFDTGTNVINPR